MRFLKIALLLLAATNIAFADSDARIRVAPYSAHEVYKIPTAPNVSSNIQFAPGERIKDVAVGNKSGWIIEDTPFGGNLFVKPKEGAKSTNVTVITERRSYHFLLTVQPPNAALYSLSFSYPEDEGALPLSASRQNLDLMFAESAKNKANQNYWVAGSEEVSPTSAWDDGRFIYLSFSSNRDMPAVYTVDSRDNESLVNTSVTGNTIVVQRMSERLMLRKGEYVATVVNKSFDLNSGKDNKTGTVSPNVVRTLKGGQS